MDTTDLDQIIDGDLKDQNPNSVNTSDPIDSEIDKIGGDALLKEEYGTPSEMLKTAGEGAASAATLGLSSYLERIAFGNREDQLARREVNPGSHIVGQIAGLAGPSIVTGGTFTGVGGAMEAAGAGGARALGLGLEGAGLASRIGAGAVKASIEGAIFQGGDELSKLMLSDPNQTADTALSNIGMAALIGAPMGAFMSGAGEMWRAKFGKQTETALKAAKDAIEEQPLTAVEQLDLPGIPRPAGHEGPVASFKESAATLKPNISELEEAARNQGVELSAAMKSGDPFTQKAESALSQSGTVAGRKTANEMATFEKQLGENAQKTLRDRTEMSAAKSSEQMREGLIQKFKDRISDAQKDFQKLKPHFDAMEIGNDLKKSLAERVLSHPSLKTSEEATNVANKYLKTVGKLETVTDVKNFRTNINKKLQTLFSGGAGGGEEGPVLLELKNALTEMREKAISKAAERSGIGAEAEGIANQVSLDIRQADAKWASLKSEMRSLADQAKLPRVAGEDLASLNKKLMGLNDNTVVDRFFPEGNLQRMLQMQKEFPKEFDLARRIRLKEIFDNSIDKSQGGNSSFKIGKFLSQITDDKMGPEARNLLFQGRAQDISDLQKLYRAMPRDFNPSHTAGAMSFYQMFTPSGLLNEASDAVKYLLLKASPHFQEAINQAGGGKAAEMAALHVATSGNIPPSAGAFKQMVNYIAQTIKAENAMGKGAADIFKAGKMVAPSIMNMEQKEKLDKKLKELQANNTSLFNSSGEVAHYMPAHGSAVSQTIVSSVNYLNSLRPDNAKKSPLDGEPVVDKARLAEYNRALDISENPIGVIFHSVKEGTVTPRDLIHLKNLYPGAYKRMASKVSHELMESVNEGVKIPYKTRLGLSLFLGQPLDSTMTPMGIASAQPQAPQQQQQGAKPAKGSMKSLAKMAVPYQTPLQARQSASLKS